MDNKKNITNTIKDFTDRTYLHPQYDEKFLTEPSKVQETMDFLEQMLNANKMVE